jgi:2-oxoglutarate dehydrogenase E1 component
MKDFTYITNSHPSFIENLYNDFVKDPSSVDVDLRKFFEGFDFAIANGVSSKNATTSTVQTAPVATAEGIDWMHEIRVYRLILGYRNKGHLIATTNPIRPRRDRGANLDLAFFGLSDADLDKTFHVGNLVGLGSTTLKNILAHLQKAYASSVGIEFKYISDQKKIDWLTQEMEHNFNTPLSLEKKKRVLDK